MPVVLLIGVLVAVRPSAVDSVLGHVQVSGRVPDLQALVDHRPQSQVATPLLRDQLVEVAPFASLAAVAEQAPHRIG